MSARAFGISNTYDTTVGGDALKKSRLSSNAGKVTSNIAATCATTVGAVSQNFASSPADAVAYSLRGIRNSTTPRGTNAVRSTGANTSQNTENCRASAAAAGLLGLSSARRVSTGSDPSLKPEEASKNGGDGLSFIEKWRLQRASETTAKNTSPSDAKSLSPLPKPPIPFERHIPARNNYSTPPTTGNRVEEPKMSPPNRQIVKNLLMLESPKRNVSPNMDSTPKRLKETLNGKRENSNEANARSSTPVSATGAVAAPASRWRPAVSRDDISGSAKPVNSSQPVGSQPARRPSGPVAAPFSGAAAAVSRLGLSSTRRVSTGSDPSLKPEEASKNGGDGLSFIEKWRLQRASETTAKNTSPSDAKSLSPLPKPPIPFERHIPARNNYSTPPTTGNRVEEPKMSPPNRQIVKNLLMLESPKRNVSPNMDSTPKRLKDTLNDKRENNNEANARSSTPVSATGAVAAPASRWRPAVSRDDISGSAKPVNSSQPVGSQPARRPSGPVAVASSIGPSNSRPGLHSPHRTDKRVEPATGTSPVARNRTPIKTLPTEHVSHPPAVIIDYHGVTSNNSSAPQWLKNRLSDASKETTTETIRPTEVEQRSRQAPSTEVKNSVTTSKTEKDSMTHPYSRMTMSKQGELDESSLRPNYKKSPIRASSQAQTESLARGLKTPMKNSESLHVPPSCPSFHTRSEQSDLDGGIPFPSLRQVVLNNHAELNSHKTSPNGNVSWRENILWKARERRVSPQRPVSYGGSRVASRNTTPRARSQSMSTPRFLATDSEELQQFLGAYSNPMHPQHYYGFNVSPRKSQLTPRGVSPRLSTMQRHSMRHSPSLEMKYHLLDEDSENTVTSLGDELTGLLNNLEVYQKRLERAAVLVNLERRRKKRR